MNWRPESSFHEGSESRPSFGPHEASKSYADFFFFRKTCSLVSFYTLETGSVERRLGHGRKKDHHTREKDMGSKYGCPDGKFDARSETAAHTDRSCAEGKEDGDAPVRFPGLPFFFSTFRFLTNPSIQYRVRASPSQFYTRLGLRKYRGSVVKRGG
jgi:hypothetical protein